MAGKEVSGMTMAGKEVSGMTGVRVFPPAPKGFDALTATGTDLAWYGLPPRPDPRTEPELSALWERCVRRCRDFEHLEPALVPADTWTQSATTEAGIGQSPIEDCGFALAADGGAPLVVLAATLDRNQT